MGSVNGRVVMITGGAAGVGAEVARRLYDKGALGRSMSARTEALEK